MGILGTYNYGCEAIIRGTVEILRRINPEIKISYGSFDYESDRHRLKDLDIEIIKRPSKFKRWTIANIIRKIATLCKLPIENKYDSTSWIKGYDTVFSIGGDMYTLSSTGEYKKDLPKFFEECQNKGLKYILWGASVGPFSKNSEGEDFYKDHLQKADLIVSRERNTTEYLNSIGIIDNVKEAPDPAFFVEGPQKQKPVSSVKTIGINLSPLSASHEYAGDIKTAIERQAEAITRILNQRDWKIVMIPHVVSPRYWEDDLTYMQKIYSHIPENLRSRITIVESDPGFVGLKSILCTLDGLVAARMHCAINTICCQVPVVLLSYSEKAKGMCKYVYGNSTRTIPLIDFENSDKLISLIEDVPKSSNLKNIQEFEFNSILS